MDSDNYSYIVINREGDSLAAQADSALGNDWQSLDWDARPQPDTQDASQSGGNWWNSLLDKPLLSAENLARQLGLTIKKPH